jgi:hypothetical protein
MITLLFVATGQNITFTDVYNAEWDLAFNKCRYTLIIAIFQMHKKFQPGQVSWLEYYGLGILFETFQPLRFTLMK